MILGIILSILSAVTWLIVIQAILSWLVMFNVIDIRREGPRRGMAALDRFTEPLYAPIRRILPDFGGIDFSPMVVLIAIQILRQLLISLAQGG